MDMLFGEDQNVPAEEAEDEFADLEDAVEEAAPAQYITLVTTTIGTKYVEVLDTDQIDGLVGITLSTALARSALQFGADNQYFIGETMISKDHVLVPGTSVLVMGSVKGG